MKKLISLLVVMAMMACLSVGVFAAEDAVITVSSAQSAAGEEVTLDVTITNNPGFAATKITLEYDAAALELVAIDTVGKLLANATVNQEKGIVSFANATNVTGDGVLLSVTFKVKADAKGCGFDVKAVLNNLTAADRSEVAYTTVAGTIGAAHTYGEWYEVKAATCTEKGEERRDCAYCDAYETRETDLIDHMHDGEWLSDAIGHWHVCEVCQEHVGYGEHTFGEAVHTENGTYVYCEICGYALESVPQVGDMSAIFFALAAVSATGLVTMTGKKKEN